DFSLTEEQELLLASIRELITSNFPEEYFRTCDQTGTYPKEFIETPLGTMQGHYEMIDENGDTFTIDIPVFRLAVPTLIH
ncbi:hypothetical protein MJN69_30475, partial [Salmonella enterica subsp. enterica serovar Kentucky]|nr:hypothetical protein [Salmonella enterica subsp. enterica serovar Kentucky]